MREIITRRRLLGAAGAGLLAPLISTARADIQPDDDGLYREPWFVQSFLDLREDLEAAHAAGKRLAVLWELKGCPYCRETHLVNFADPTVSGYIRENFDILQLNYIGARKVTDFDGASLGEKEFAARYNVRFTPTTQFFPETAAGLSGKAPLEREVARAPGYLRPQHFLAMFRFVREKAYDKGSFRDYLARAGG